MMKLNWIEFENLETGLKCERVNFNKDTTLLVGISGVGKSQILHAIITSLDYATHKIRNNTYLYEFTATLNFTIDEQEYEWYYKIEDNCDENLFVIEPYRKHLEFTEECLKCNGDIIIERCRENIKLKYFDDVPTPKKDESLLFQYAEDQHFQHIFQDFEKIYPLDLDLAVRGLVNKDYFIRFTSQVEKVIENENGSFNIFSRLPVPVKLYVARKYFHNEIYVPIFDYVKELFPEMEDIDVTEDIRHDAFVISINTFGRKLLQEDISNGMLKTIYYIVELVTMKSEALVLIDEFENGLGVNCLDILSELLINERNDLQFIITSHHPKIIGGIPTSKWKIIDRVESTIINSLASELGIDDSIHNSYFNLIKRWELEGKI